MTATVASTGGQSNGMVVKSKAKGHITSPTYAHYAAFGDLIDTVRKETGNPDVDSVLYSDPMGFRTRGPVLKNSVHMPSRMYDGPGDNDGWNAAFEKWNSLRPGQKSELREAAREVKKATDRTSFSLPIFVSPEVYVSTRQNTPFADMAPRVAVQEDTIQADEQTGLGLVESFDESGPYPNADGGDDDEYENHEYDVEPYGGQREVTDFVQLSAGSLRSTQATTEEAIMRAMRQYEEKQVFQGSDNDADGFVGLPDLIDSDPWDDGGQVEDMDGAQITVDDVTDGLNTLERRGAVWDNVVHFTDHQTFSDLSKELKEFSRYDSPEENLSFGFQALELHGTAVVKTHGVPNSDGEREFWSVDMGGWYMGMLQDATLHPLAKTDPTETFAVDAYGTLVGEGTSHVLKMENLA